MGGARRDVVLEVAGARVRALGPVVALGSRPGPGGVVLPPRAGVSGVHVRLAPGEATVRVWPVGAARVAVGRSLEGCREAPPMRAGEGAEVPPGTWLWLGGEGGVAVQVIAVVGQGVVTSQTVAVEAGIAWDAAGAVPARPSRGVAALSPPARMVAVATAVLALSVASLVALVLRPPEAPGPARAWASVAFSPAPAAQRPPGVDGLLLELVVAPSLVAAGGSVPGLQAEDPTTWDARFLHEVAAEVARRASDRWLRARALAAAPAMAEVADAMVAAGLPEVLAGVPLVESGYTAEATSPCCARGWWQFMPEAGVALRGVVPGADVHGCARLDGAPPFTPQAAAPPPRACAVAPYVQDGACALGSCAADFRTSLARSTAAAIHTLSMPWRDPAVARTGAAVPLVIASHHAGWDDEALGAPPGTKPGNVRPALARWRADHPASPPHQVMGALMLCASAEAPERGCQRYLPARTQRYPVAVVAWYVVARCTLALAPSESVATAARARLAAWGRDSVARATCARLLGERAS